MYAVYYYHLVTLKVYPHLTKQTPLPSSTRLFANPPEISLYVTLIGGEKTGGEIFRKNNTFLYKIQMDLCVALVKCTCDLTFLTTFKFMVNLRGGILTGCS